MQKLHRKCEEQNGRKKTPYPRKGTCQALCAVHYQSVYLSDGRCNNEKGRTRRFADILGQILILRKRFQWIQLIQVPLSFLFGWFTDISMWIFSFIKPVNYVVQLASVLVGTAVLGFGIALSVIANVVMNSGEAFVKAVSDTVHREFGNVKVVFDVSCVITAVALSLIFFDLQIVGTREGTVISALCTGFVVKPWNKLLRRPVERILVGRAPDKT